MRAIRILCSLLGVAFLLYFTPKLVVACQLVMLSFHAVKAKAYDHPYVFEPLVPWPAPISREEFWKADWLPGEANNITANDENRHKVIWGHWHQGVDKLPGLCQIALQSWQKYHPDWHIIILSEDNYKNYVAHTDLPSTFSSLKIQTRGDLIRSAVLQRYGGLYLDLTYVVLKAFDDLWDTAEENGDLYITSLWSVTSKEFGQDIVIPNNCLLVAPQPNNPALGAMHQHLLNYFESPSQTTDKMTQHPVMSRVSTLMDHQNLRLYRETWPYLACLWSLVDTFYFNPDVQSYVKDHVYILPTLLWTIDAYMTEISTTPDEEITSVVWKHESMPEVIRRAPNLFRFVIGDDPAAADRFVTHVNAVKTSSDFTLNFDSPFEYFLNLPTTQGRVFRAALNETAPIRQASIEGAYHIVPIATAAQGNLLIGSQAPNDIRNNSNDDSMMMMMIFSLDFAICYKCFLGIVFVVAIIGLRFLSGFRQTRSCRYHKSSEGLNYKGKLQLKRSGLSLFLGITEKGKRAEHPVATVNNNKDPMMAADCCLKDKSWGPSKLHFRKGCASCPLASSAAFYSV